MTAASDAVLNADSAGIIDNLRLDLQALKVSYTL